MKTAKDFTRKEIVKVIGGPHCVGKTGWVIFTSEEYNTVHVSVDNAGYGMKPEWLEKIETPDDDTIE